MRRPLFRAFIGIVAFTLPALVIVIGRRLDRSTLQHDPRYATLIPIVLWSSVVLAALLPCRPHPDKHTIMAPTCGTNGCNVVPAGS